MTSNEQNMTELLKCQVPDQVIKRQWLRSWLRVLSLLLIASLALGKPAALSGATHTADGMPVQEERRHASRGPLCEEPGQQTFPRPAGGHRGHYPVRPGEGCTPHRQLDFSFLRDPESEAHGSSETVR